MIATIKLRNMGTVNKNTVFITTPAGTVTLYFSYETIIGVNGKHGEFISKNEWSKTTGKFLNELQPDKRKRFSYERVQQEIERALAAV